MSKDEIIRNALIEKDNIISQLNSTLEILQMKLRNSEEENAKIEEKIRFYHERINSSKN